MKKIFLLAGIGLFIFSTCKREIYPRADFAASKVIVETNELISFTNQSRDALSYVWEFGDGGTSNAINPSHSYLNEGFYTVRLTARSEDNNIDISEMNIEVISSVTAEFVVNKSTVQPGESVLFTNLSQGAVEYSWDFGDGFVSSEANPSHYFDDEGDYLVSLTVRSASGTTDVATLNISVLYTLLEITVAEWNEDEIIEFIVPGAFVILYESYDDWLDDVKAVVWGRTDAYGEIAFAGLDPISYWVWAEADSIAEPGDHYDNYDFKDYKPEEYLATQALTPYFLNTWLAWVDYFPPDKALGKRQGRYEKDKYRRNEKSYVIVTTF